MVGVAADRLRGRVIVVGPSGRLLSDSAGNERVGVDYSSRPEIAAALDRRVYQERRPSQTLGQEILATAVPISDGDESSAPYASPRACRPSAAPRAARRSG